MSTTQYLKKIRPVQLIAVIFFTVSGGPYGLEPLLEYAGQHGALLVLLITPMLWDVPAIFTVLELNSMMPVTGGYYKWVKYALGTRWGFYEGWWTWLYTFVDLAIYPVLFIEYASFFFPHLQEYKVPVCLATIWASAGLNILGIVPVGRVSLFLGAAVLTPFLILCGMVFFQHSDNLSVTAPSFHHAGFSSLGMSLFAVMWNCLGWDNTTTYAEEVENPVRSYLISTLTAFVLVIVVYFLVIYAAQLSGINPAVLSQEGFPALGQLVGGHWLGALLALGGMASTLGIYAAVLLSVSRIPQVMSADSLLPARINKLHSRFNTPYISIIICSVIVSFMIMWTFGELLVIDITIYTAGLSLEYLSLIKLRRSRPHMIRPFKIPFNVTGLCFVLVLPAMVYLVALGDSLSSSKDASKPVLFALAALATAELAWQILRFSIRKKNAAY